MRRITAIILSISSGRSRGAFSSGVPGIGRYFVRSISGRDYPVIIGTILIYAALVAVMNLIVDIMYGIIDPRISYE